MTMCCRNPMNCTARSHDEYVAPAFLMLISHRKQRKYAEKILPIRKNGHLLLITLLLANMVVNEALPVISEPVFGGGIVSVAASTVLIVM